MFFKHCPTLENLVVHEIWLKNILSSLESVEGEGMLFITLRTWLSASIWWSLWWKAACVCIITPVACCHHFGHVLFVYQENQFQFKYIWVKSLKCRFLLLVIPGSQTSMNESCESPSSSSSSSCPPLLTPTGNGPDVIGMFDMDPSDMAMSSVSSQQNFDPRRHSFSEEELKPQPMIKKARKILVPDNMKVSGSEVLTAASAHEQLLLRIFGIFAWFMTKNDYKNCFRSL